MKYHQKLHIIESDLEAVISDLRRETGKTGGHTAWGPNCTSGEPELREAGPLSDQVLSRKLPSRDHRAWSAVLSDRLLLEKITHWAERPFVSWLPLPMALALSLCMCLCMQLHTLSHKHCFSEKGFCPGSVLMQ